jgi:hypothetical protein
MSSACRGFSAYGIERVNLIEYPMPGAQYLIHSDEMKALYADGWFQDFVQVRMKKVACGDSR